MNIDTRVSLLASKVRLTPLNNSTLKTVPRIELCSAKLGVELVLKLVKELSFKINKVTYWSDSLTVLRYIKSESLRFHRFVDNKVCFIRNFSDPNQWNYVPSKSNPADLLSRGAKVSCLIKSRLWNHGPLYLVDDGLYPDQTFDSNIAHSDDEVRREAVALTSNISSATPVDVLMNSVSSWYKLKVRIAWLQKFVRSLRHKPNLKCDKITVNDLQNAELTIFKYVQNKYFPTEMQCILKNKNLPKSSSLRKLTPFIDVDGVLRVGGRLANFNVCYDVRHPIILPSTPYVITLFVQNVHRQVGHLGRESILSVLRSRYWLLSGNSLARKIVNNCLSCRKYQAKVSKQLMADLPSPRVTCNLPAFSHVGVDYFGPFYVAHGRKTEKRYGVIFSCMSSRAIHLETSYSLSTDSFICSLRRFICRRGNVLSITSDNGTNLTGGNRELRESIREWNGKCIESWLKQKGISWHFNPPYASHFGGFFEREIRSVRKVLTSLLNEQPIKLNDEYFVTVLCEVEAILNNRPLTEISSDPSDIEALTPNHVLLFNAGVTFPPGLFTPTDCYIKKRWRQVQYIVGLFWSRWRKEYVTLLQQRQKWTEPNRCYEPGDLVLVVDVLLPRNRWPLGKIQSVNTDSKGLVRSANIKVSKSKFGPINNFATSVIERPITKLVLLRCCE